MDGTVTNWMDGHGLRATFTFRYNVMAFYTRAQPSIAERAVQILYGSGPSRFGLRQAS